MHSDFNIGSAGIISLQFRNKNIFTFKQACSFVKTLPYRRNSNKNNPLTLFEDECGTCSTKHATLMLLATENQQPEVKLYLGIYKMNPNNTPGITAVLQEYQLDYLPEAHNYLKVKEQLTDCTAPHFSISDFQDDLMEEIEISPQQITAFKVDYHKRFLQQWLKTQPQLTYSLEEIWNIRELCIEALSKNI